MSATRLKIVVTFSAILMLLLPSAAAAATDSDPGNSPRSIEFTDDNPCCKRP